MSRSSSTSTIDSRAMWERDILPHWEPLQHFSYDSLPSLSVIDPTGWSPLVRTLRSWLESSRVLYLPALPHGWGLSNALKYSHRLTIARYGGNIALATNAGHKYLSRWQWNWSQNCILRVFTFLSLTLPDIEGEFLNLQLNTGFQSPPSSSSYN